jgi:hypothetical protein
MSPTGQQADFNFDHTGNGRRHVEAGDLLGCQAANRLRLPSYSQVARLVFFSPAIIRYDIRVVENLPRGVADLEKMRDDDVCRRERRLLVANAQQRAVELAYWGVMARRLGLQEFRIVGTKRFAKSDYNQAARF